MQCHHGYHGGVILERCFSFRLSIAEGYHLQKHTDWRVLNVSIDYLLGRSTSKLSPDVFEQTIMDDTTVGDVVRSLQHLSPDRKRAACTMVADMEVASIVHIQGKRKRT